MIQKKIKKDWSFKKNRCRLVLPSKRAVIFLSVVRITLNGNNNNNIGAYAQHRTNLLDYYFTNFLIKSFGLSTKLSTGLRSY